MKKSISIVSLLIVLFVFFQRNACSQAEFDHQPWHEVLLAVVSEEGFVDYDKLRQDSSKLDLYLAAAEKASPANRPELFPTRNDELVYWLQVYNALAMKNVLNFPGLKKTSDKKLRFFKFSKFVLGGEKYSLSGLENKLIRKDYPDARVHFFLNCASYSCPQLYREPLKAETLGQQLDRFARNFLNSEKHVRFDIGTGVLKVSKILKWYEKDFLTAAKEVPGGSKEKIVAFINRYRDEGNQIPVNAVTKIKYIPYNWTVNDIQNL